MIESYSLHHVDNEGLFPFEPADYSLFKFGHVGIAQKFGKALFQGMLENRKEVLLREEIVIFPSPYMAIPTASNYLAKFFKIELDLFLFENNLPSSKIGKIHRNQTYTVDYGNLSFEERKKLIANDTYYIDRNVLENKTCIFIDDIKITGSHEFTVKKILDQYQVQGDFFFMYFAELVNKNIDPKIENYLNYYQINSLNSLIDLMHSDEFVFNTRVIKYILSLSENDFDILYKGLKIKMKELLKNHAISNDYHLINQYKINLNKLYYGNQLTERTKTKY